MELFQQESKPAYLEEHVLLAMYHVGATVVYPFSQATSCILNSHEKNNDRGSAL